MNSYFNQCWTIEKKDENSAPAIFVHHLPDKETRQRYRRYATADWRLRMILHQSAELRLRLRHVFASSTSPCYATFLAIG
jgi:hypothetical protein